MIEDQTPASPNAELNRLRAAVALIPIIESGLSDSKLSVERAALMASFCEWAAAVKLDTPEAIKLSQSLSAGLARLKTVLVAEE
jgi:hypothetical protein